MKNTFGCDILNLEFSTRGDRDIGIVEPVLCYLELKYNLNIVRENINNNFPALIKKHRPHIVLCSNNAGTYENFELFKYARLNGIKTISFISEGDIWDDQKNTEICFWGNNKEGVCYNNIYFQWSEKNVEYIRKYIPQSKGVQLPVSGYVGMDRYTLLEFKNKDYFFKKYNIDKKYTKVVGIAGYPFYVFLSDKFKGENFKNLVFNQDTFDKMGAQKDPLKAIYRQLITENPDTFFILKYHPGDILPEYSEFEGLDQYENTIKIVKEEAISDIISISDLWMVYESLTCVEAWLLKKPTLLVNPGNAIFERSESYDGNVIATNFETANRFLKQYFDKGVTDESEILQRKRSDIIKRIINKGDGTNHVVAAEKIYEFRNEPPDIRESGPEEAKFTRQVVKKYNSKQLRKYLRRFLYFTPMILLPSVRKERMKDKKKEEEYNYGDRVRISGIYRDTLKDYHKI